ncbi:TetR/AcrR family transcriptional regulator [Dyella sp. Tek66A03]|uniref:TetR/AcrR family transcriptional regulator n=1 Tax=Dyella sp. Tek66A03 TaxID=3458298 RepID=UPI00403E6C1E
MARPRNFNEDQVLDIAIGVFREKGYEGTSTEDLVSAMGIGRQSLYGAFGDKRSLYLAALRRYNTQSVTELLDVGRGASSPMKAIEAILVHFVRHHGRPEASACMGVNAICEFGTSDEDVLSITRQSGKLLEQSLARWINEARDKGEIDKTIEPKAAAQFVAAALTALKVTARGGAAPATSRNIVAYTLRSLSN